MPVIRVDRQIFVSDQHLGVIENGPRAINDLKVLRLRKPLRPLFYEKLSVDVVHYSMLQPRGGLAR
jgi:hypothetical protein